MASNGLVANLSKTKFMLLNNTDKEMQRKFKIGPSEMEETMNSKLLTITMDNDQKWTSHFWR